MPSPVKIKDTQVSYKSVLSAVKKLSAEEKQLLRLQLTAPDALKAMKAFEKELRKKRPFIKKSDAEIVKITTSIRKKRYAKAV